MPIYVYICEDCGHTFEELLLSRDSESALTCPQCRAQHLKRIQSTFATSAGSRETAPTCGGGACSACSFDD